MRVRCLIAALVSVTALVGGPAAAAPPSPPFTDPCGTEGLTSEPADGATTPWTDICSGQFETLADGSLRLTVRFAGEITDDRFGYYVANWRAGECGYQVSHDTGLGEIRSNGVVISDLGGDWLRVRCGAPVEVPCPPVASQPCFTYPYEHHYQLPNAVAVEGNAVTWTLRFAGDLAPLAASLAPGVRLTNASVESSTKVFLAGFAPGYCYGTQCGQFGGDYAAGGSYTVGG